MNMSYVTQAECYYEWRHGDNRFGIVMYCTLMLKQLLVCEGCDVSDCINPNKVIEEFRDNYPDKTLCLTVWDYFHEEMYESLATMLKIRLAMRFTLQATPYAIHRWCTNTVTDYVAKCGDMGDLARNRLIAMGAVLIPMLCKYVTLDDLRKIDTVEQLVKRLYYILYASPEGGIDV